MDLVIILYIENMNSDNTGRWCGYEDSDIQQFRNTDL